MKIYFQVRYKAWPFRKICLTFVQNLIAQCSPSNQFINDIIYSFWLISLLEAHPFRTEVQPDVEHLIWLLGRDPLLSIAVQAQNPRPVRLALEKLVCLFVVHTSKDREFSGRDGRDLFSGIIFTRLCSQQLSKVFSNCWI